MPPRVTGFFIITHIYIYIQLVFKAHNHHQVARNTDREVTAPPWTCPWRRRYLRQLCYRHQWGSVWNMKFKQTKVPTPIVQLNSRVLKKMLPNLETELVNTQFNTIHISELYKRASLCVWLTGQFVWFILSLYIIEPGWSIDFPQKSQKQPDNSTKFEWQLQLVFKNWELPNPSVSELK